MFMYWCWMEWINIHIYICMYVCDDEIVEWKKRGKMYWVVDLGTKRAGITIYDHEIGAKCAGLNCTALSVRFDYVALSVRNEYDALSVRIDHAALSVRVWLCSTKCAIWLRSTKCASWLYSTECADSIYIRESLWTLCVRHYWVDRGQRIG